MDMDDPERAESKPDLPKRERHLAVTLLACVAAAAAVTVVGFAFARIIAPAFIR